MNIVFKCLLSLLFFLHGIYACEDIRSVGFKISESIFDEVAKPKYDRKNGMMVFFRRPDESLVPIKFASGVFPTMTKNPDESFVELVDIVSPGQSRKFKKLYRLFMTLSDLINKRSGARNGDMDASRIAYNQAKAYVADLREISGFERLGSDWKSKGIPGNTQNREFLKCVEEILAPIVAEYIIDLKVYYVKIQDTISDETDKSRITEALGKLGKLLETEEDICVGFKRFMSSPDAEWLRNFAHTEDIVVYQRSSGKLPSLEPMIFSLNDLCHICRGKFSPGSNARSYLPRDLVFCSVLKKTRPKPTTVDFILGERGFATETGHTALPNVCQIRVPNPDKVVGSQTLKVNFLGDTTFIPRIETPSESPADSSMGVPEASEE